MGVALGRNIIFMTGEEGSYGGGGTLNRAHEIVSESLTPDRQYVVSEGLGGQPGLRNLRRTSRRVASTKSGGGDVVFEVPTSGFGRILKHALGGFSGPTGGVQTFTLGSLEGKSLVIQKQMRDSAGSVLEEFTAKGCKITSLAFSNDLRGILRSTVGVDFREMVTDVAAGSPAYPSFEVFHYQQSVIRVAGSTVAIVRSLGDITLTNNLETDREYLGSGALKSEPVDNDYPTVTGTLSAEFDSAATFYDRFAGDTPFELQLEWVADSTKKIKWTVAEAKLSGTAPQIGDAGPVVNDWPFEGFNNGSSDLTITYTSPDTSI